jgi:hypothetical protein
VSALHSPNRPRSPEPDQVEADRQVEDFVRFWRAGEPAKGSFRCVDCGFGVATVYRLPLCARCHGPVWERADTSPFEATPPAGTFETDLIGAARAIWLGVALSVVLWLGLAGLAFGIFKLIHG